MNELIINCFLCNITEGEKLQVFDSDLENEDEEYIDVKVKTINNKINIIENGINKKEYNIKKMKVLYESQVGDELVVDYKGRIIRFCI